MASRVTDTPYTPPVVDSPSDLEKYIKTKCSTTQNLLHVVRGFISIENPAQVREFLRTILEEYRSTEAITYVDAQNFLKVAAKFKLFSFSTLQELFNAHEDHETALALALARSSSLFGYYISREETNDFIALVGHCQGAPSEQKAKALYEVGICLRSYENPELARDCHLSALVLDPSTRAKCLQALNTTLTLPSAKRVLGDASVVVLRCLTKDQQALVTKAVADIREVDFEKVTAYWKEGEPLSSANCDHLATLFTLGLPPEHREAPLAPNARDYIKRTLEPARDAPSSEELLSVVATLRRTQRVLCDCREQFYRQTTDDSIIADIRSNPQEILMAAKLEFFDCLKGWSRGADLFDLENRIIQLTSLVTIKKIKIEEEKEYQFLVDLLLLCSESGSIEQRGKILKKYQPLSKEKLATVFFLFGKYNMSSTIEAIISLVLSTCLQKDRLLCHFRTIKSLIDKCPSRSSLSQNETAFKKIAEFLLPEVREALDLEEAADADTIAKMIYPMVISLLKSGKDIPMIEQFVRFVVRLNPDRFPSLPPLSELFKNVPHEVKKLTADLQVEGNPESNVEIDNAKLLEEWIKILSKASAMSFEPEYLPLVMRFVDSKLWAEDKPLPIAQKATEKFLRDPDETVYKQLTHLAETSSRCRPLTLACKLAQAGPTNVETKEELCTMIRLERAASAESPQNIKKAFSSLQRGVATALGIDPTVAIAISLDLFCHQMHALPLDTQMALLMNLDQLKIDKGVLVSCIRFHVRALVEKLEPQKALDLVVIFVDKDLADKELLQRALAIKSDDHRAILKLQYALGAKLLESKLSFDEASILEQQKAAEFAKRQTELKAELEKVRGQLKKAELQVSKTKEAIEATMQQIQYLQEKTTGLKPARTRLEEVKTEYTSLSSVPDSTEHLKARIKELQEQIIKTRKQLTVLEEKHKSKTQSWKATCTTLVAQVTGLEDAVVMIRRLQTPAMRLALDALRCPLTKQFPKEPVILLLPFESLQVGDVYESEALRQEISRSKKAIKADDYLCPIPFGSIKELIDFMGVQDSTSVALFPTADAMCAHLDTVSKAVNHYPPSQYRNLLNPNFFTFLKLALNAEIDPDNCYALTTSLLRTTHMLAEQMAKLVLSRGGSIIKELVSSHDLPLLFTECRRRKRKAIPPEHEATFDAAVAYLRDPSSASLPTRLQQRMRETTAEPQELIAELSLHIDHIINLCLAFCEKPPEGGHTPSRGRARRGGGRGK